MKERYWELELEIYLHLATLQQFPFSFTEFLNLPLYMKLKAQEIFQEIIKERTKQAQSLLGQTRRR